MGRSHRKALTAALLAAALIVMAAEAAVSLNEAAKPGEGAACLEPRCGKEHTEVFAFVAGGFSLENMARLWRDVQRLFAADKPPAVSAPPAAF